ncbi:carbamoyl-phosphate synthase large subunit [Thalassospiraceae bacterium LMO-JJ14]|nr:carbamoyl-phosphate synthase large subunit [Thalassospiraceae bacterium LMO-JJ14]
MPKRTDIKSIMIIGAGPIVIGQACEFDYSGAQACKALREEGYRVILVNSNPATIMTDPSMADATYIEPITPEVLENIIAKERPDALLPTMGGQTGLNAGMALAERGTLEKYGVELIGAKADVIAKAEDRLLFRDAMDKIGLGTPKSEVFTGEYEMIEIPDRDGKIKEVTMLAASSKQKAMEALKSVGLPAVIRPAFTLGGTGGGIAYTTEEYEQIVTSGVTASPINQVLIEESVLGWKEFEMEVVRDNADNCIIICSIENVDPMGVHTGDSITVAPALTLTDKEYQIMRDASIAVLREIGVDTGGSNVQFAVNPEDGRLVVIEMNPRVSRSSALASKATGFPIAKVAAKLACGYTLDELQNDITGVTPASFEPTIDYVVTKIPRFTFEKFPGTTALLTTSMKSVGEAMAMGRTFEESLQKGLRSMETGLTGMNEIEIEGAVKSDGNIDTDVVKAVLSEARPDRIRYIAQAIRHGMPLADIQRASKYDIWFLERIKHIVDAEEEVRRDGIPDDPQALLRLKKKGFSDERLAELAGGDVDAVTEARRALGVLPVYKRVDTCAAEFASQTSYMYSCYEGDGLNPAECEAEPTAREKVAILGGGPNRIGQGIEFDYCCVHAAYAMKEAGFEAIMVNCNPETVSTDYDTSDRLYFEPLTAEDVIELLRVEQRKGTLKGVIVQLGGQTPLKLAAALESAGIPILGTSPDAIDLAEDRERFQALLQKTGLRQPANGLARSQEEALKVAHDVGYPLVIRPSYVLGGRAMEIVHDDTALERYMREAVVVSGKSPVLLDSYLQNAIEVDVDALCDGSDVYVAGIMQHIEEAGIHSGDSACSLPPFSLSEDIIAELERQAVILAKALGVVGLMNVQFAVKEQDIYILEVNPRASRTVPFVAKATGVPIAKIAARLMAGEKLSAFTLPKLGSMKHVAVKEAVFPFSRFPGVDTLLGPEMKSTGEVMGIDRDFHRAFAKSQLGAGMALPMSGGVFISVRDADKDTALTIARILHGIGFEVIATGGTQRFLEANGVPASRVNKVLEGRPHCVDALTNGDVQLVINTTEGARSIADSYSIRRTALTNHVPHYTTMTAALAAAEAIAAIITEGGAGGLAVAPLQAYFDPSY